MRSLFRLAVATLAAVAGLCEAEPAVHRHKHAHTARSTTSNRTDAAAGDFYLRVMPLGASITYGFKSADGNGFRKVLRQALRAKGWQVNMVGDVNAGWMKDNVSDCGVWCMVCVSYARLGVLTRCRTTRAIRSSGWTR